MRCKKYYSITLALIVCGLITYLFLLHSITITYFNETSKQFYYTDLPPLLQGALLRPNKQLESSQDSSDYSSSIRSEGYTYECCDSNINYLFQKSILYLKLYKCASSTLQNILMRFGLRYELNFMLRRGHSIAYHQPFRNDTIPATLRTSDGKYDILTHHIRFSSNLKNVFPPNTVSVTLMRSVPSLFVSIYYYFKADLKSGKSLEDYLKNPFDLNIDTPSVQHGLNHMSMDLGFEREDFQNESAIESFIQYIDSQFDLVMIAEYMEESIVLLAHLMGWPLEYVTYLPMNRRKDSHSVHQLTQLEIEKIKELNNVDTLLYEHFLKKFQKCRHRFGIDRLQDQVRQLREMNQALEKKCVLAENVLPYFNVKGYWVKNPTDWDCIYSTKYADVFTEELMRRQSQRLNKKQNDFEEKLFDP